MPYVITTKEQLRELVALAEKKAEINAPRKPFQRYVQGWAELNVILILLDNNKIKIEDVFEISELKELIRIAKIELYGFDILPDDLSEEMKIRLGVIKEQK